MDPTVTAEPVPSPAPDTPASPFAESLPDELGETDPVVRKALKRLVKQLGEPLCAAVLAQTVEIEASGGLFIVREKRRRTKGGVFLALLKAHSKEAKAAARRVRPLTPAQQASGGAQEAKPAPAKPFVWANRKELFDEALRERGQAMTAKLTLIGRPGKVVEQKDFVVTSLESRTIPPLPKGLPVPASPNVTYTVFIANKQWQKVATALKNPEDMMIIEGVCVPDEQAGGVAVMALSSTTKMLQRQKLALAGPKGDPMEPIVMTAPKARTPVVQQAAPPPMAPVIAAPAAPAIPDEEQVRTILRDRIAKGQTFEAIALKTGLPLNRLSELHDGRPTSLSAAQIRTFLQRLKAAPR